MVAEAALVPAWSLFACSIVFGVGGFLLGHHAALGNQLDALRRQEERWLREED